MKCSLKILFFLSFLMIRCSSSPEVSEEIMTPIISSKPNILFVIADDMGKDATPTYTEGSIKPDMPVLQGIIDSGIRFNNLWSYSVCTPTRASILTGKYGVKTNILKVGDVLSTSEIALQKYINTNAAESYATAIVGKWHLSTNAADPITMGIDYYAGLLTGGVQSYTSWNLTENGITSNSTVYTTTKFTDLAINWVANQTKPWFLWLAFNAPHTPFHLAPTNLHSQGNLPTDNASINANPTPYYMSAIEAMDSELGRFLDSLSTEERANTVIIFIGDNGTPNKVAQAPYSRTKAKGSLYQGGINVPMIISGAGVGRVGDFDETLINTTDLFITIANIAGASSTEVYNSKSFYNLLSDANSTKRDFIYSEKEDAYTIRNEQYKLIQYANGTEEFYNLSSDPYENSNLIGTTLSLDALNAKSILITEAESIRE